jgi:hypothetical protein
MLAVFVKEALYYAVFSPEVPISSSAPSPSSHFLPTFWERTFSRHLQFCHNMVFVFRPRTVPGTPGFNLLLNPSVNVILPWDVTPCSPAELCLPQVTRLFSPCSVESRHLQQLPCLVRFLLAAVIFTALFIRHLTELYQQHCVSV